jgi:uncharacterized protein with LGFP repeats
MATMSDAVKAALFGPERKKLKIYDHEFNVKPAQPEKQGNRLLVNGQLSHHLSFRPDDQVYYVITIEDAAIKHVTREISRGGAAPLAAPIVSAVSAYYGAPIPPDKAEEVGRALGGIVDGKWETAAQIIIANIALAFQQQERDAGAHEVQQQALGTDAHEVHGWIREKWAELGGEAGFLGAPVTDETGTPDGIGRYNHFQGGSIYCTPDTGAHEVHGEIRNKWMELGWERSFLGYPLTDETTTPDGIGRYNHFQGGSIYWTPETGAHEIHGEIRNKWAELGWERSALGYPLTDETPTPDGVGRLNDFQRGSIRWHPDTGAQEVYGP